MFHEKAGDRGTQNRGRYQVAQSLIEQTLRTKRLGNSIFVKSNIKLFIQFTNGNLSRKFFEHGTFPFNHVKVLELSHNCAKRQVKAWGRFFLQ